MALPKKLGVLLCLAATILQAVSAFHTAPAIITHSDLSRLVKLNKRQFPSSIRISPLTATASDEDNKENESTIAVAVTGETGQNDEISKALRENEVVPMLGLTLDIIEIPCIEGEEISADLFTSSLIQKVEVACFGSDGSVNAWMTNIDKCLGKEPLSNGDVVAVCMSKDIANICLQSKRWESANIYYPAGEEGSMQGWINSGVQAFGDINERKFWGGGW